MNPRKTARYSAAILIAAAMAVSGSLPAFAAPSGGTSATALSTGELEPANRRLRALMHGGPGLDATVAKAPDGSRDVPVATEEALDAALGDCFGGACFDVATRGSVVDRPM